MYNVAICFYLREPHGGEPARSSPFWIASETPEPWSGVVFGGIGSVSPGWTQADAPLRRGAELVLCVQRRVHEVIGESSEHRQVTGVRFAYLQTKISNINTYFRSSLGKINIYKNKYVHTYTTHQTSRRHYSEN